MSHGESGISVALSEAVADRIAQRIIRGDIPPGQQLVEESIQKRYQVSKSPVREAFRILSSEGLVEIRARRGCFVASATEKDIRDNYEVRKLLEGYAARLAYDRIDEEEIERVDTNFSAMQSFVGKQDVLEYTKHHSLFHDAISSCAGNDLLEEMRRNVRMRNQWYQFQYHSVDIKKDLLTHKCLLDAIQKKDVTAKRFQSLVEQHIQIGLDNYNRYLHSEEK